MEATLTHQDWVQESCMPDKELGLDDVVMIIVQD
jgi:hypothetical protein